MFKLGNREKRGQVTLFVIVAIVIIGIVGLVYSFYGRGTFGVPSSVDGVYSKFLDCVESAGEDGILILESNGGRIDDGEFYPGSRYSPSSSHLTFAGEEIAYWSYLDSAGIEKENVPSIESMQLELADFVKKKVSECSFDEFADQGFLIKRGEADVSVEILKKSVEISVFMDMSIEKGEDVFTINKHKKSIRSDLGKLFNDAMVVYNEEVGSDFLEERSIDILRMYAPMDGAELTCSPMTWSASKIYDDLREAIEANFAMFSNNRGKDDYYNIDLDISSDMGFVYSRSWPTYMEVDPSDGDLMIAKPVGKSEGFSSLGFCYVPYHFVYNFRHPVLIRLDSNGETFQFPVVVRIEGNVAKKSRAIESIPAASRDVCSNVNTSLKLNVYDNDLNGLDADISVRCFGVECDAGSSKDGVFEGDVIQCVNGIISASADGYKDGKVIFSTINPSSLVMILDKEYSLPVRVLSDGGVFDGKAIISYSSNDYSGAIMYPDQKEIVLSQGNWEFRVELLSDSNIVIPAGDEEVCVDVPRRGVLGLAGLKEKECSVVQRDEEVVDLGVSGGGSSDVYFSEGELSGSGEIIFEVNNLNIPKTLEDLEENYVNIESDKVGVRLE